VEAPSRPASHRALVLLLAGLFVCLLVAGFILHAIANDGSLFTADSLSVVAFAGFFAVGAIVLLRRPGHALGAIFAAAGLSAILTNFCDAYARLSIVDHRSLPGATIAAWLQNWTWFIPLALIGTFGFLLFPSGTLPTPRWKWVAIAAAAGTTIMLFGMAFSSEALDGFPQVDNPVGFIGDPFRGAMLGVAFFSVAVAAVSSAVSVIVRYVRARGDERLQLKWVVYAVVMMVAVNLLLPVVGGEVSEGTGNLIFAVMLLLLPCASGVAILKYRLYEIDLIINRTLVYGASTGLLAGTYLALVFLLQPLFASFTGGSDIAIAASTLAVAAMFRPLRARVQTFIDARFYRRKFDSQQTLDAFNRHLRDEIDISTLVDQLTSVVSETMQPTHVTLWLREDTPAALAETP
jgi:hypothetical protein